MLFLDLDGTLLDVRERHYAAYRDVLSSRDMRGVPVPVRDYWGFRTEGKPVADILKASRLFPTKFQTFRKRFEERVEAPDLLTLDRIRPGVDTALGKLHTKTPIALVTQRRDGVALENQLAAIGLARYFAAFLFGTPEPQRRPHPDHRWKHKVGLIRRRYRMPPTEAVYIGDTDHDVKVAREFRWDVFLVEGGHRTKEIQIKADPDRIVPDLSAALKFLLPGGRWQR